VGVPCAAPADLDQHATGIRGRIMTTPKRSFWSTMPGLLTAAGGFVTAAAGLIAALASLGLSGKPDEPSRPPVTAVATPAPPPVKEVVDEPPQDTIDLVYRGDNLGCMIYVVVDVGGQTAQPTGSRFTMTNVPDGVQHYTLRGTINCTQAGVCEASGSGSVNVVDGGEYYVTWLNTSVGRCGVTLTA
jgi:hypothetical protein